jgi:sigma-B regulation protein RsbU (phosphoserine phosphatase)
MDWHKEAINSHGLVSATPFISKQTGDLVNCSALSIRDSSGAVIGVLGYFIPTDTVLKKTADMELIEEFKGSEFAAFDKSGRFIVHTRDPLVGRSLSAIKDDMSAKVLEALKNGSTMWTSVALTDGEPWFVGFKKSRFADLYVLAMVPLSSGARSLFTHAIYSAIILLVCVGGLWFVIMRMAYKLAEPLNMLSNAAQTLSQGKYPEPVPTRTEDELGQLVETFNTMTRGLKQRDHIRNTFGRYLPEEVVERLLESEDHLRLGGEEREVTLLMSDLRGFTAQTAGMAPEKVIRLLNRYLAEMIEIIMDHKGIVDEITGDGILAIFGAPAPSPDHPVQAVTAAIAMQSAMGRINILNESDHFPMLEMGIGIITGSVVLGNIGSHRRTKYGAVGSVINMLGRIESYCVGGQILLDQSTYDRVKDSVTCRESFSPHMKGFEGPVNLYDIGCMATGEERAESEFQTELALLSEPLLVSVRMVEKKLVGNEQFSGKLTHISPKGAILCCPFPLPPRSEIAMEIKDSRILGAGVLFAKVSEVATPQVSKDCSLLRFTVAPREVRTAFSRLVLRNTG